MKSIAKYLSLAAFVAFALASCSKVVENAALLNPDGTPVQFTLSGDKAFSGSTASLKVTASTAVPSDVTINLALLSSDPKMPAENLSFPLLVMAKGSSEVSGKVSLDPTGLTPDTNYKIELEASIGGVPFTPTLEISFKTDPAPAEPEKPAEPENPGTASITIDGDPADWVGIAGAVSVECAEGAELTGLKSAKAYYSDKLYFFFEFSEEALAKGVEDGKLRFHIFFNGDNNKEGGLLRYWDTPDIDYMTEGKVMSGDAYCDYSSKLYQWAGEDPSAWSWNGDAGILPEFACAGKDSGYEMSMDYSVYPGGLADEFTIAFDVADGDYNVIGYLPNVAEGVCPKIALKKAE